MIVLKTDREIKIMQEAGRISAMALKLAGEAVEPGVTTYELDSIIKKYIISQGASPSFLNYDGFPASSCISVNNMVIHGIPSKKQILKAGDIVSIDVGANFEGFHGDNANTFACADISDRARALIDATRESFYEALKKVVTGARIGDIGNAVEGYVKVRGYSVVRDFVGHGVGAKLHEDPSVPNYGTPGRGARLLKGMTIAIEPMINEGTSDIEILDNGWTVVTADGKLSAHYENTIAITENGPIILTKAE